MTSSLVGSEMCIRDRSRLRYHVAPFVYQGGRSQAVLAIRRGLRNMTVSYTHLTLPTICSV
eukprot:1036426-Prorocentrum_lima.AAC.1